MKFITLLTAFIAALAFFSFIKPKERVYEFSYPKTENTTITITSNKFKKFTKHWRGTDYWYQDVENQFMCQVLFYKLNDTEKEELVAIPKTQLQLPNTCAYYPFAYFTQASAIQNKEINGSFWGNKKDDFMFNQNDVNIVGTPLYQKHMYGYCMLNDDIFVKVHLFKHPCSSADSIEMIHILNTLTIKRN